MQMEQELMPGNHANRKRMIGLCIILALSFVVFIFSARYDLLEEILRFSQQHEDWQVDELLTVAMFLTISMTFFSIQRWVEIQKSENLLLQRNKELGRTLSEVKQLRGILPICASCKKIRDDSGYWHQVEAYIHSHTDANFSHSICPDCIKKLYPEFVQNGLSSLDKPV